MASVRESYHHLTTYLPFVKSNNDGITSGVSSSMLAHCTIWHLLYMAGLLAAFVAGGIAGHLYWRRVRAWARRSHARVHRWVSTRRDEAIVQWDGVVARVEGAIAGWNNMGTGKAQKNGTFAGQQVIPVTTTEEEKESPSPAQHGGGGKRKRKHHIPGMGK